MRQKGFATIFGLCLMLVVALIVKGIQDAEANHAREVVNFETEQALQLAAESAIVEAAEKARLAEITGEGRLPYFKSILSKSKVNVLNTTKHFKRGEREINIAVDVWGERGKIYVNNSAHGTDGVYFMGTATIDGSFFGEKIYRRAFAYVHSEKDGDSWKDDTTIYFMELPYSMELP